MFKKILIAFSAMLLLAMPAMAYEPVTASIPVECKLGGTIEMTPNIEGIPMPEKSAITVKDKGEFLVSFTEPDYYEYTIKQIDKTSNQMTYDDTVYTVKMQVEDLDGELAVVVILDNGKKVKPTEVHFENKKRSRTSGGSSSSTSHTVKPGTSTPTTQPSTDPWLPPKTQPETTPSVENNKNHTTSEPDYDPDGEVNGRNRNKNKDGLSGGVAKTGEYVPYGLLILALVGSGSAMIVAAKKRKEEDDV